MDRDDDQPPQAQAVIEIARNAGSVGIALDGLRDEVEGFIEASGERVN